MVSNEKKPDKNIVQYESTGGREVSPWRRFVEREGGNTFPGDLIKFRKGDWSRGENDTEIEEGTKFVAIMDQIATGRVKWVDNKPEKTIIGLLIDDFEPPPREALGDMDKSLWPRDANGVPKDPWQEQIYLVLQDENGELCTFASSSEGGRKAVKKLCDRFDRLRGKHPGCMPVVGLFGDSYPHKNYGKVDYPIFDICGWQPWDTEQPTAEQPQPKQLPATAPATTAKVEPVKKDTAKVEPAKAEPALDAFADDDLPW